MSPVRNPLFNTFLTAFSIRAACLGRTSEWRSIIAADMIIAIGLAMSLPAMSGAEPPDGSNKPLLLAPIPPERDMP
jgi:hypothetical protein